ncbi:PAS domain-containing sensor histidine kinase [Algibacter miyuki]|uniref:histidine kinase n=1 Tax=Algibacter miyuki TaxID=1306933 RepID=A0ABV5H188_9FLAO|nr:PAS domain-containing sensor histidine kinase [Algibacter miyuki]MDN3664144.1 PAS domain-containing sensor histidine kinase [Algibacter miyuki]
MSIFSQIQQLFVSKKDVKNLDALKWQFAVKNSKIGVWDWDAKTNNVFYSDESKEILGYESHEIKDHAEEWNKRVHPEDRDTYYSDFQKHLAGEKDSYENEHRVLCKDGTYKWILDSGKVVSKDKNGKPLRVIGTHVDITQRKRDEILLSENFKVITKQNKRFYNFTHIISHNLKTHIDNFENILEFYDAAESENEKEQMFEYLRNISSTLTDSMTDLTEVININSEQGNINDDINLNHIINNILRHLKIDIDSSQANIYTSIPSDLFIKGNSAYLESIFHNLISNAIKYRDATKPSEINIKAIKTKNGLDITIADNGIGIDLDKYEGEIFGMYKTFHKSQRKDSKGIGLYLTKLQVEDLGGEITVESTINEGTEFKLSFPKDKAFIKN